MRPLSRKSSLKKCWSMIRRFVRSIKSDESPVKRANSWTIWRRSSAEQIAFQQGRCIFTAGKVFCFLEEFFEWLTRAQPSCGTRRSLHSLAGTE